MRHNTRWNTTARRRAMRGGMLICILVTGIALLALAGCGTSSSAAGNSGAVGQSTQPSTALVHVGMATVNGAAKQVLTDAQGKTLYYLTKDSERASNCTAACATLWPPLLVPTGTTPKSATTLSGSLSALDDANGRQALYNGHLLYTYSKDSAAGQANGDGFKGVWYVATPDLPAPASGAGNGY